MEPRYTRKLAKDLVVGDVVIIESPTGAMHKDVSAVEISGDEVLVRTWGNIYHTLPGYTFRLATWQEVRIEKRSDTSDERGKIMTNNVHPIRQESPYWCDTCATHNVHFIEQQQRIPSPYVCPHCGQRRMYCTVNNSNFRMLGSLFLCTGCSSVAQLVVAPEEHPTNTGHFACENCQAVMRLVEVYEDKEAEDTSTSDDTAQ